MSHIIMKQIILVLFLTLVFVSCQSDVAPSNKEITNQTVQKTIEPETKYGIEINEYDIKQKHIKIGQTLGDIFHEQNLSYNLVLKASNLDSIFDIRKIRTGNLISYFINHSDSIPKTDFIVYEINQANYVVFDLKDSLNMYLGQKEKTIHKRQVAGKINSSLWNALVEVGTTPVLSIELSEIYAWSIDFFGLQKNDAFSIIYKESYIDSVSSGIEEIKAVRLDHAGNSFYAFHFKQDSIWSFFDERGNSLKKAFLKAPLKYSRISSRFSNSRLHPILKIHRPHHGVDYAAPKGTPVHTVGAGKVIKKGWDKGGGRYVKIKHNSVYTTLYMHFSKFGNIKVGDYVQQGDIIGYVGSSGYATGPHLDFRYFKNGTAINPLTVKSPPVEPITDKHKEEFMKIANLYQSILDSLINIKK